MARDLISGSAQDLFTATMFDYGSGGAFTYAAWINPDSVASIYHLFHAMDNAQSAAAAYILIGTVVGSGDMQLSFVADISVGWGRTSTGVISAGVWQHLAVLGDGSDGYANYSLYVNGILKTWAAGGNATGTKTAAESFALCSRYHSSDRYFDGQIAEAAIWDSELAIGEVGSLAKGFSPLLIRPVSLVSYWPLIGRTSPELDRVGGYPLSLINAPLVAPHPSVIYPSKMMMSSIEIAEAGGAQRLIPRGILRGVIRGAV